MAGLLLSCCLVALSILFFAKKITRGDWLAAGFMFMLFAFWVYHISSVESLFFIGFSIYILLFWFLLEKRKSISDIKRDIQNHISRANLKNYLIIEGFDISDANDFLLHYKKMKLRTQSDEYVVNLDMKDGFNYFTITNRENEKFNLIRYPQQGKIKVSLRGLYKMQAGEKYYLLDTQKKSSYIAFPNGDIVSWSGKIRQTNNSGISITGTQKYHIQLYFSNDSLLCYYEGDQFKNMGCFLSLFAFYVWYINKGDKSS